MTKIKDKYLANTVFHNDYRLGTISDLSGNGNNAAFNGSPYFTNSSGGRCLKFDGATDYLKVPYNVSLFCEDVMTVSFWFKSDKADYTSSAYLVSMWDDAGSNEMWAFAINHLSDQYNIISRSGGGGGTTNDDTNIDVDTDWHQFTLAIDNANQIWKTFVDGVLEDTSTGFMQTYGDRNSFLTIGALDGSNFFDGKFRNVQIINALLTDAECSQLYGESLQEGHYDRVDIKQLSDPARNLLPDGDMEAVGVADYVVFNNASLAKETDTPHSGSQYLKVSYNGTAGPGARVNNLVQVGKTYRFRGWAKSDGTWNPQINDFGGIMWQGTTSTSWQYFDFVKNWTNAGEDFILYSSGQTSGYTAWDDITVQEVPNSDPVYIADGRGWNVSVAAENAGFLSNTDWELNGTNTTIVDTGMGNGTKRITTDAAGTQGSRPSTQAYGTWGCKMNRGAANFCSWLFIHTDKHGLFGAANSYNVSYRDEGTVRLRRAADIIVEDTTTRAVGIEIDIKVTRDKNNLWELFVDGVSIGTGTEATYTGTGGWSVLDMDQDCVIRDFRQIPYIE